MGADRESDAGIDCSPRGILGFNSSAFTLSILSSTTLQRSDFLYPYPFRFTSTDFSTSGSKSLFFSSRSPVKLVSSSSSICLREAALLSLNNKQSPTQLRWRTQTWRRLSPSRTRAMSPSNNTTGLLPSTSTHRRSRSTTRIRPSSPTALRYAHNRSAWTSH